MTLEGVVRRHLDRALEGDDEARDVVLCACLLRAQIVIGTFNAPAEEEHGAN